MDKLLFLSESEVKFIEGLQEFMNSFDGDEVETLGEVRVRLRQRLRYIEGGGHVVELFDRVESLEKELEAFKIDYEHMLESNNLFKGD